MPRKFRKKMRARRYKRRKGARRYNRGMSNRALQPIPQRYVCKMKYADTFSMTTGSFYRFNLNSIFDPNRTGTGHQPYSHDTLATLYNRYRVFRCNYAINVSSGSNIKLVAVPANEEILITAGDTSQAIEQPRAKYVVQMAGGSTKTLRGSVNLPSLMGRSARDYKADDRFQAAYGTSPSELAILNIMGSSLDDAAAVSVCSITLTYYVESFDAKNLGQS